MNMVKNRNQLLTKGVFAIAVVAIVGIVGGVNFASAQSQNSASANGKPTKEQCAAAGYKNYGQCVKVWAQDKSGYGSTVNNSTSVNMTNNNTQSVKSGNVKSTGGGNATSGSVSNSSSTTMSSTVNN
jgi:hypothetical protein